MSKYQLGDRVRILSFCGLYDGVTGITGTVVIPANRSDLTTVQVDRLFLNVVVKRIDFTDEELEFEDNRNDAAVGELMASVGDIIVTNEMKSCTTERKQWMLWNTYFKGDAKVTLKCPDCYDTVDARISDISNICYWNREPSLSNGLS